MEKNELSRTESLKEFYKDPFSKELEERLISNWYIRVKDVVTQEEIKKYPILQEFIQTEELAEEEFKVIDQSSLDSDSDSQYDSTEPITLDSDNEYNFETPRTWKEEAVDRIAKEKINAKMNLDWWTNINDYEDIKKQIVQAGVELLGEPDDGDICTINFISTHENGQIIDSYFNYKVCVGCRDISEGLDIVLKTMRVDECSRILIDTKYLCDKRGKRYDIPNVSHVWYLIRLLNIERKSKKLIKPISEEIYSLGKIVQINDHLLLRNFLEKCFIQEECEEEKTKWYNDINLETFEKNPITTCNKIAIAEMIMEDYDEALQTVRYVLASEPDNMTASYLKDTIIFLNQHKNENSDDADNSTIANDSELQLLHLLYPKIQSLKNIIIKSQYLKNSKFNINGTLWIMIIGASVVTLGTIIKLFKTF